MSEYSDIGKNIIDGMIKGINDKPFDNISAFRNFGLCVDVETLERYGIYIRSNNWRKLNGLPMRRRRRNKLKK